jgi:hypothetical protein
MCTEFKRTGLIYNILKHERLWKTYQYIKKKGICIKWEGLEVLYIIVLRTIKEVLMYAIYLKGGSFFEDKFCISEVSFCGFKLIFTEFSVRSLHKIITFIRENPLFIISFN